MSEIDAAELARLPRENTDLVELLRSWAKVLDIPSGRFVNEDLEAAANALEKARGDLEERQGLEVTEGICFDRVVRERDAARALLREALRELREREIDVDLRARIAKELGQ